MKQKRKRYYTIPCSSKFALSVTTLAKSEKTSVGEIARVVFFLFSPETIEAWEDPGDPAKHDRETVQIKTGSNSGKTMRRKPRIQLRLPGGYTSGQIRKALDIAIKLKNRHKFIAGNTMPALFSEFREKPEAIQKELQILKRVVSKLLFTPIEDGVKTRADALYIFGFSSKITPPQISVSRRYKELASIYHPDTALGSHSRMTQINQAYQILKN